MDPDILHDWARQFLAGQLAPTEFRDRMLKATATDLGHTLLDTDRSRRCGFPEVVFGEGKSLAQLTAAADAFRREGQPLLMTRLAESMAPRLVEQLPGAHFNPLARTLRWSPPSKGAASQAALDTASCAAAEAGISEPQVAVVTAGTTDRAVAEESLETLAWMQVPAQLVLDVGVAGPLRLWSRLDDLRRMACIVVVAGMEGALPSVVGGWVACPVIAVPTSVGYGAHLHGLTTLLAMLTSCAPNVAVVNIDGGFKAGYLAGMIARQSSTPEVGRTPEVARRPAGAMPPADVRPTQGGHPQAMRTEDDSSRSEAD